MLPLTPDQLRALDRVARERFGLPTLLLMEHASLAIAKHAQEMADPKAPVLALCGTGNNGGDAAAAARHLFNLGRPVEVWLVGTPPPDGDPGDHAVNLAAARKLGIPFHQASPLGPLLDRARHVGLLLDGLLGTGLKGPLRPPMLDVVRELNLLGRRSLAIDIPSGLSGLTGEPMPVALRAERTVTLGFPKVGFAAAAAQPFLGQVFVEDIGYPRPIREDPLRYAEDRPTKDG